MGLWEFSVVGLFKQWMIIVGVVDFGPARIFIKRIYDDAFKWGQPISMDQVEFCPSQLSGGDAALLGAAYLSLRNLKK